DQISDKVAAERRVYIWNLLLSNLLSTSTVLVRRGVSFRFPHGKRYSEDYHLWLKLALERCHMARMDAVLAAGFRRPYGESGQGAALVKMQYGQMHSYISNLTAAGWRGRLVLPLCLIWSTVKFIRRVTITLLHHLMG